MNFLIFIGGLGFFLFGLNVTEVGLRELAGDKIKTVLRRACSTPLKGAAVGCVVTAVLQSSSSVTVMLIGLVEAEIIEVGSTFGVIIGANVGTSATAWIIALCGKSAFGFESLYPVLILVGSIFIILIKNNKLKKLGLIPAGLSLLIAGMRDMSAAVVPLIDSRVFSALNNPLTGLLTGILVTAVIQSSSASVGILQAVSTAGALSLDMAIPTVIGQNLGTCVTALIACIGASKSAKKIALTHLGFNGFGLIIWGGLFFLFRNIFSFDYAVSPIGIAVIHTLFNLINAIIALLFKSKRKTPAGGRFSYASEKLSLPTPQRGHSKSSGKSSNFVPGAMPFSGEPSSSSYSQPHTSHTYFIIFLLSLYFSYNLYLNKHVLWQRLDRNAGACGFV